MIYLPTFYLSSFNISSFIIAEEIVYFIKYTLMCLIILIKEKKEEKATGTKK